MLLLSMDFVDIAPQTKDVIEPENLTTTIGKKKEKHSTELKTMTTLKLKQKKPVHQRCEFTSS